MRLRTTRSEKDAKKIVAERITKFIVYRAVKYAARFKFNIDDIENSLADCDDSVFYWEQQQDLKNAFGIDRLVFTRLSQIRYTTAEGETKNQIPYKRIVETLYKKICRAKSYSENGAHSYRPGKYFKMFIYSKSGFEKLCEIYEKNPDDEKTNLDSDWYEPVKVEIEREQVIKNKS